MDLEFHYWITGIVAKRAGFSEEEAATVAYASQYVDENDISMEIQHRSGAEPFKNFMSQTMNILKPKQELMRIYPIFHFIPGEPDAHTARRKDGKMHRLCTTPNNRIANDLLDAACQASPDTRIYRIGIAAHAFVDTWAHQNFVGWYDHYNNIGLDLKPDIGHADGEHHPDWVAHQWVDPRLVQPEISNTHRFLSAARALYDKLCTYHGVAEGERDWEGLKTDLERLFGRPYTGSTCRYHDDRMGTYRGQLPDMEPFDEMRWFDAAIETKVRGLPDSGDGLLNLGTLFRDEHYWREDVAWEETHWHRFQVAVKDHEVLGIALLKDKFALMGLDLSKV